MEFVMKMKADAVIVGTGVGGLFSALNLPRDKKIIMITKSDLESSDSFQSVPFSDTHMLFRESHKK